MPDVSRRAVASILLVLEWGVAGCAGDEPAAPPPPVVPLRAEALPELPRLPGTVHCGCTRSGRLAVLSDAGPTLLLIDPDRREAVKVVADGGDGPADLPPGPAMLSIAGDSVLVHHPTRGETRVYGPDGALARARHPYAVVSAAAVDGALVVAMHTGWKRGEAGRAALGVVEAPPAGAGEATWHLARRIERARVTGNRDADYLVHLLQRVRCRDGQTFYRVFLWGGDPIEIRNARGRVLATVPVPVPGLSPTWAAGQVVDEETMERFLVLRDAQSDAAGRLHLLLPGRGEDGRDPPVTVIVMSPEGTLVARHPLDRRLACLAVTADGATYYGVDAWTGEVVRVEP